VAVLAALALSSCVTDDLGLGNIQKSLSNVNLFDGEDDTTRTPLGTGALPAHAQMALTAAVLRLRGQSAADVRTEINVAGSEQVAPESGFSYDGFAVTEVELLKLETPENNPSARKLNGYLHLADGYNRRASVGFDIDYQVAGVSPVVITRAVLAPAFPRGAKAVMYVVPGAALEAGLAKGQSYGDLYRAVRESAIDMRSPASVSAPAERAIVVFFEDRLPAGDRVAVGISDSQDGLASHTDSTRYLAFKDGWAVAMIPGRFALGPQQAFWVKAVHEPAAGKGGKPDLVGLFSTDPTLAPTS
jgi:hypothetical protein